MSKEDYDAGWNAALEHVRKRVGMFLPSEEADTVRFYICKSAERNGVRFVPDTDR